MGQQAPSGKWQRIAENLGLTLIRSSGVFGERVRFLAGERNGYLLTLTPGHAAARNAVEILARFPQRMTILGFREDLLKDPALVKAFGWRGKLSRQQRRRILVGDGAVVVRLPYMCFEPGRAKIERVTKGLVDALTEHIRPLDRLCEICGRPRDLSVYLADGVPGYFCAGCVENYQQQEAELAASLRRIEPEIERGIGVGLLGAGSLGVSFGALAAVCVILGGALGPLLALPVFVILGFLVSFVATRAFLGFSASTIPMKLPIVLVSTAIAFTAMNAIATMTLRPAIWNLVLLKASSIGAVLANPSGAGFVAAAAAAGWLAESVLVMVARLRPVKLVQVERLEIPAGPPGESDLPGKALDRPAMPE